MKTYRQFAPQKSPDARIYRSYLIVSALAASLILGLLLNTSRTPLPPVPPDLNKLPTPLRDAITRSLKEVEKDRSASERHIELGLIYEANHLWKEAVTAFENVILLLPDEPLAFRHRFLALRKMGNQEKAREALDEMIEKFPGFAPSRYDSAELFHFLGDYTKAEKEYQALIRLAPNEWRGYSGLGDLYLQQKMMPEAITVLEKAVRLAPDEKIPHYLLGRAYLKSNRTEAAEKELSLGTQAEKYPMPDDWLIRIPLYSRNLDEQLLIARQYFLAGALPQANRILLSLAAYYPDNVDILRSLALIDLSRGDSRGAYIKLEQSIQTEPDNVQIRILQVNACLSLGMPDQALLHATTAVRLEPSSWESYFTLANVQLELNRNQEATQSFQNAVQLNPDNPDLRMDVGDIMLGILNRPDDAEDHYTEAMNRNPDYLPAYRQLIQLYEAQGNLKKAEQIRSLEIKAFPQNQ